MNFLETLKFLDDAIEAREKKPPLPVPPIQPAAIETPKVKKAHRALGWGKSKKKLRAQREEQGLFWGRDMR